MKYLNEGPAYNNCYHFTGVVKYRKSVFYNEEMRGELTRLIKTILEERKGLKVHALAVAYNHIHVLVEGEIEPAKIGSILFGATSRLMRQAYPQLKQEIKKGLWGGTSCKYITGEAYFERCCSYINRHQADNTKIP